MTKATVAFNYKLTLLSVSIKTSGKTITCEAELGLWIKGELKTAAVVPFGKTEDAKAKVRLILQRDMNWDSNGRLNLSDGSSRAIIDPITIIESFPKIADPDFLLKTNILLESVSVIFRRAVNDEVNKRLALDLPSIKTLAEDLKKPHDLGDNATLKLHPRSLALYPITSTEKMLNLNVALQCRPEITIGCDPLGDNEILLAFPTTRPSEPGCHFSVVCRMGNQFLGHVLDESIGKSGPVRLDKLSLAAR